jgi:hypothetical protein
MLLIMKKMMIFVVIEAEINRMYATMSMQYERTEQFEYT